MLQFPLGECPAQPEQAVRALRRCAYLSRRTRFPPVENPSRKLNVHAVVLAGGAGRRLWPASTPERPKPLLPLIGGRSLVAETVDRAARLCGEDRVTVLARQPLLDTMRDALSPWPGVHLLAEPEARGTAPALVFAAHELEREHPGAVMVAFPSDHLVRPVRELGSSLRVAEDLARNGHLCCLGVTAAGAEPGYGHILTGNGLGGGAWRIKAFVEKPDPRHAAALAADGCLWNTGIFVFGCADLLAVSAEVAPELAGGLETLGQDGPGTFFRAVRPVSIDVAVMERTNRAAVVLGQFEWDDLGTWEAVARRLGAGRGGGQAGAATRNVDSGDNVVWAEGRRVTLLGVTGLAVVESGGEILVADRDQLHRLSELDLSSPPGPASGGDRAGPRTGAE